MVIFLLFSLNIWMMVLRSGQFILICITKYLRWSNILLLSW